MHSPLLLIYNFGGIDHSHLLIQLRELLFALLLLQVGLLSLQALFVLLVPILFYVLSDDPVNLMIF